MKDHAGLEMGAGSSKWKPEELLQRQCLGRMFRPGDQRSIVVDSVEKMVCDKIESKLKFLSSAESTGLNLHDFQIEAGKRLLDELTKEDNAGNMISI